MYNPEMRPLGEARSAIREAFEYANKRKQEIGEENVYDFSIGNPSVPAPACVREEVERLFREVPPEKLHGYTSAAGAYPVRAAVANYIESAFGVPMSAEEVYMTCGASSSLTITFRAILQKGEEVILLTPYFPEYEVFVRSAGGVPVAVATAPDFHLDLEAIGRAIGERTRAIIVNSPNNPTGAVYSEGEMRALGALLKEKSERFGSPILLIADEPYRELCYIAPPVYPMCVYENTVVLYSFSKSLSLAGERIGYIAVSPHCTEKEALFACIAGAGRALGYVCAPATYQYAVAACLGKVSDLEAYRSNRDLFYGELTRIGYHCIVPEGAFYLFVQALEEDAVAFAARAQGYELLVVPSDSFGAKGYVRISYCVSRETIERSIPAFEKLYRAYRG